MKDLKGFAKTWLKIMFVSWALFGISQNFLNTAKAKYENPHANDGETESIFDEAKVPLEPIWVTTVRNFVESFKILWKHS